MLPPLVNSFGIATEAGNFADKRAAMFDQRRRLRNGEARADETVKQLSKKEKWWAWQGLNLRPLRCQHELPTQICGFLRFFGRSTTLFGQ